MSKRIPVTPKELRTAFRIWLRVAPGRFWRRNEEAERLSAAKRHNPGTLTDPRSDLADYMADKFFQANWEQVILSRRRSSTADEVRTILTTDVRCDPMRSKPRLRIQLRG